MATFTSGKTVTGGKQKQLTDSSTKKETTLSQQKGTNKGTGLGSLLGDALYTVAQKAVSAAAGKLTQGIQNSPYGTPNARSQTIADPSTDYWSQKYGEEKASEARRYGIIPSLDSSFNNPFYQPYIEQYGYDKVKEARRYGILISPEEQEEATNWMQKFAAYDSQMRSVGSFLNSNDWSSSQDKHGYQGMVDGYLTELALGISGMKEDSLMRDSAMEYYKYWQQVKQGLQDKQEFFSQFQDENEYTGYKWASESAAAAQATGKNKDEWYQSVQAEYDTASAKVKQIQDQIRYLTDSAEVYENGIYMGTDHSVDGQIQQLQRELNRARKEASKAQEILQYAGAWRYSDLTERADYAAAVERGRAEREQFRAKADQEYKAMIAQYAEYGISKEGSTDLRGDYYATNKEYLLPTDEWTDEQRDIHAYLFATDREKADEYARQVNDTLNAQTYVQRQQKLEDFASRNVFTAALSTAASVATMPMSFFDYLDNVVEYRERGVTTQRRGMTVADYGNVMTGAVAQKLNEKGTIHTALFGDVGLGDAYQLGNSIIQSVTFGHLLGAVGTSAAFFGSAAKSGFEDAKARGVSDGRAIAYGFFSGLAEAGCEYVSLDKLLTMKTPKGLAGYLKNALIQAGVEGSEEGLTTLCNMVSDAWISGDKSEIRLKIQEYMEQGMSYSMAEKQAMKEWMQGIASDIAGGAISGGISTGGEMIVRSMQHTDTATTRQLVEQGLRTVEGSEARQKAEQYAEAFGYNEEAQEQGADGEQAQEDESGEPQAQEREQESGKYGIRDAIRDARAARKEQRSHTLSVMEADRLAEAIEKQDVKLIADAAQSRLEALGVTENTSKLAEAIAAHVGGETPTVAQRYVVSHSLAAQKVLKELDAENMRKEAEASIAGTATGPYEQDNDWAKNIGTARVNADVYNGNVAESFRDLLRSSQARGSAQKSGAVQAEGQTQQLLGLVLHDGELQVKTRDGSGQIRYVAPDAVQIEDQGTADFIRELTGNPGQYKNAPAMYENYQPGQDIGDYINAWNMAENVYGYTSSASVERAAQNPVIKGVLSDVQLRTAFDLGRSRKEQRQAERSAQSERAAGTQTQEQESTVQLRKGSVSFEGGTIDGITYAAVDRNKLTGRRRAQVEAITMFAEATGIDVVFYQSSKGKDGKYQGANGVYHDGKIWLDVNAGLYGENSGRVAIVRTAGHELTHYIQENAPELYEDLKSFLVDHLLEWKGKSLSELVNEKLARDTTGKLDFDGALDEVVADGCEMMLKRSSVVSTLARENPTLFDRIHDWLKEWAAKIRKAFSGVEAYHEEARAMLDYMDQLQKLWDKALTQAARNAADVGTETKTAASDGGRVQYNLRSIDIDRIYISYGDVTSEDKAIQNTVNSLIAREKYVNISARDAAEFNGINYNDYKEARKAFRKILRRFLGETITISHNGQMAEVYLTSTGLNHAAVTEYSPGKAAIYKKLRKLVMNAEYSFSSLDDPHSTNAPTGRTEWDAFVSVARFGKYIFPTVIKFRSVDRDLRSQIYNIASKREIGSSHGTGLTNQGGSPNYGGTPISNDTVTQKEEKSNPKKSEREPQMQERDFIPDDRELLMEAASKRGSSAELKAYSRKVKQLDTLQHKLERQQALLADAEEQDKAALRRAITKTEQQIERAENALVKLEASPAIKTEARKAMAEWREANPNQAAETLRRLRDVNRALEKDLAYWKGQAKRTEPGENSVRPEDVRRMARQLVKDYSSEADLQEVTDRLQELGDYIVSGGEVNYEDVRHMAREVARLIVDTAYTQEDDSADLRKQIKDYLRSTRLRISDELRGDKTDLDYYRKHNMGTLRLANEGLDIDVAYQEMQEMFGEGLFPKSVTAHGDMLDQILETLEGLEPTYVPVFQRTERNEAMVLLANQIIDRMISDEIRQAYTDTDRAYQAMGRRMQAAEQRAEEAEKRADDIQKTAAIDRRAALQELRKDIAQRQEKRQKRINIDKIAKRLGKWLTENSAKNHVPESMKKAIGEFLLTIDLRPGGNSKEARKYERRMRDILDVVTGQQKFLNGQTDNWSGMYLDLPAFLDETIQEHLKALEASNDGEIYDVKSMGLEQLQQLEEILTAVSRAVMTANELLAGEQSAKVSEVGEKTIDHLDRLGPAQRDSAVDRFLQFQNTTPYYFFKRFGEGGMQIFRELQEGWSKLAFNAREIIEYAEDTYSSEEARRLERDTFTVKLHKRLLTGQEGDDLRSKTKEAVTMTRAQAMEIYALSRRKQALGHLLGAGIRLGDIDQGRLRGKIRQADNYLLDLEDIAEITGKLSKREKEIVEALQKHMNTRGTEWGNEVSMARFGIRQFTEENYWPISTDSRTRPVRDPGQDSTNLFRLLNMSFTKNTIRGANNAIVIGSAFDTYSNHMADMAKYNALGLALLDTMKWMSYSTATDADEAGHYTTTSVQTSAERAFGAEAQKYFITFMKDMNGTHEAGRGEKFASRMMSNYKVAAVAANLRVAFLQPTAYVRAVAVLDAKYLRKGLAMSNKQGRAEAEKYSGTAVWKSLGFYDTNINAGLREMIKHTDGAKEKIQEFSMKGAEWGDKLTWGTLWNACKAQVQDTQHLTGEALMKATAEKFDEVVYRTQVMDSTMTRSHNMRQKGVFAGMTTAFMSEPTLSYNMVLDAYNQYKDELRKSGSRSAAWQKVKGYVGKSFLAYVSTAVAASIVESLVDAARDDDEFQSYAEKFLEAQFGGGRLVEGNLFADLLIHNKLPIVKDLDSMLRGYSNSRMDQEWMASMTKAGRIWKETLALATGAQDKPTTVTYNGNMTAWGKIYATLKAASQLSGLPGGNLGREVVTAWNNTLGAITGQKISTYDPGKVKSIQYAVQDGWLTEDEAVELLLKTDFDGDEDDARQQVYEWSLGDTGKYDAVLAAVKAGDKSAYESAMQTLTDYGYSEKTIRSEVAGAIKEWYQTDRYVEKKDAIKLLQEYGGKNPREAEATVQKWTALVTAGIDYDQIDEQLLDGQITARRAVELYQRYGGMTEKDAKEKVQRLQCEIDTGISFNDIKDEFIYGELSEQEAVEMRVKYGGADQEDAEKAVRKWGCERDTGIRYEDIDEEYISGNISAYDAMRLMQTYGGLSAEYAEGNIILYDFRGDNEQLADAYVTTARKYYEFAEAAGLDKVQYYQAYRTTSSIESDKDENGNTVKYSLMNKRMAYIDSLSLTPAQKDALFLCFYQSKSLKYAPWRK